MGRYSKSEDWLQRAERTIPLGSQTFSKSRIQYPVGISPLYIEKAKGCYVWDVDGNKYVDLVSSLASVTLGYNDRRVNSAVKKQLKRGVSFSLPGRLEAEVAELICDLVPSAEMVRFGKNGTDATSAAIRLARAYTGKNHIGVCGYHGWQDWYIGSTTRNKGIPRQVSELTHTFSYNDINSLKKLIAEQPDLACVIMEPMNTVYPKPGYLEAVRDLTSKYGVLLIFDETITGFRFSKGGAQELFDVTPDLSTFGKGIANGFPLSAVVGKREIMKEMEEIFFSSTFGGELLSLAAAKTVLKLHQLDEVSPALNASGMLLGTKLKIQIDKYKMNDYLTITGHPTWQFLNWKGTESVNELAMKTYFMQEIYTKGCIVLNTLNVTTSMGQKEISHVVDAFTSILIQMKKEIEQGTIQSSTKCEPIQPLFKIR